MEKTDKQSKLGKKMRQIFSISLVTLLTACTINVTPLATGGSKADGTVIASYEYGVFQKPVVDMNAAYNSAKKRCQGWGYKNAEAFDAAQNECITRNGDGNCRQMRVNITYQCIK